MKIKSKNNANFIKLIPKTIRYYLNIKSLLISFITLTIIFPFSLMLIYYGAHLQKTQTMATIQQIIYNAFETKTSLFSNYLHSFSSSPDIIYLDIDFKGIQKLNYARDLALSRGQISSKENNISVKGKLSIDSKNYNVRISPTGLNLDMIGHIDKRAFKLKVLDGKKIYGMSEFKLLPPHSRHNIVESIGHALEKKEKLISLRYFFVKTVLNGSDLGVYAIEEHFNKELLENNKAREGVIFSIKKNGVKIFNENKLKKKNNLKEQVTLVKSIFQGLQNDEIEISRVLDLEKFSSQYAIIDLMDGYHALGTNSVYYLNPITNLIEPITREYNSLRYSDGLPNVSSLLIERDYSQDLFSINNPNMIIKKLFENKNFISLYLKKLYKLSDLNFLNNFFEEIEEKINSQLNIIYIDDPFYKFPKEYLYHRQIQILEKLNSDLKIVGNIDINDGLNNKFLFKNHSVFPIKLIKIFSTDSNIEFPLNNIILPGKELSFENEINEENKKNFKFSYKIEGVKNIQRESVIVQKSFSNNISLSSLWNTSSDGFLDEKNIKINHAKQIITFQKKIVNINNDLFFPANYVVQGKPGLVINLLNGASIFSRSAFNFKGSADKPIKITSLSRNGGGLVILSAKKESIFTNTIFENLQSPKNSSGFTGSVTIYDTKVLFEKCFFNKNKSEDFLNLVKSKYVINKSAFTNIFSDGFDSDFSNGVIKNTKFNNIGNDALDFSGSVSKLSEIYIDGVGDKALSAGEISKIEGKNIYITNAEIAVTSKDLSKVFLNEIKLNDTKLGFAIFQKKEEYGAASAFISNLELKNVETLHLVGSNSSLSLNNKNIVKKIPDVETYLYGNSYGIISKR